MSQVDLLRRSGAGAVCKRQVDGRAREIIEKGVPGTYAPTERDNGVAAVIVTTQAPDLMMTWP